MDDMSKGFTSCGASIRLSATLASFTDPGDASNLSLATLLAPGLPSS
jgi:hypothetical protein